MSTVNEIPRRPWRHLLLRGSLIAALVVQSAALISQQMQIDDLQVHHIGDLAGGNVTPAPSGPPGPPGPPGPQGREGKDGKDGKDGSEGREGREGRDGKDGKDGKDGQNAAPKPSPTPSPSHHKDSWKKTLPGDSSSVDSSR
ncbi:hypothetical protein [Kitasatospora sp. NPDC058190]|uniref:hypothetical protein n=1 Tax=Kitasatospora sp. NPDC058190 TaxID=3346371 RepID=UPI0036D7B363